MSGQSGSTFLSLTYSLDLYQTIFEDYSVIMYTAFTKYLLAVMYKLCFCRHWSAGLENSIGNM